MKNPLTTTSSAMAESARPVQVTIRTGSTQQVSP